MVHAFRTSMQALPDLSLSYLLYIYKQAWENLLYIYKQAWEEEYEPPNVTSPSLLALPKTPGRRKKRESASG